MILAIWLKGSLKVLEKKNITEAYNRYDDETYQKKVVYLELRNMGFDWECMSYGLFETEEEIDLHLDSLKKETIAALEEVQRSLKGTEKQD